MADWVFDSLVGFLKSPFWSYPLSSFIDHHCTVFDPGDENKFSYTDIHKEYQTMVEKLLESFTSDLGITSDQFADVCSQESAFGEEHEHLFEQILAADNFLIFKSMMVQKNIDLELQALSLLQRQLGYSPNAYRPGDPEEDFLRGKTAGGEDDALLEEALKQSKEEFDLQQSLDEEETARLLEMAKAESLRLYQAQQREQEELAGQLEKALQASGPGPVPASDSGIAKGLESARLRSETAPSRSEVSKKPEQEPGELSTATPRAPDAQGGTVEELAAENSTHRILRKPEDHRSNEPSPAIGGVSPKHSHLPPSQSPAREQRQQESPKPPSLGGLPLAGGGQIKEVGESPSAGGGQIKEVGESTLAGGGQIKEVGRAPSAGGGQIIKVGGSPSAGGGQIKEVGESPSAGGEQFEEVGRSPSAGRGQIKEVGRSPSAGGGQIKEVGKSPSAGGGQTKEVGRSPSAGGGQTKEVGRSPSAGGGQTKEVGRSPSAGGGQTKEVGISPSAGGGQTKEVGKSPSAGGGQTKEVGKSPSAVGGGGEGRMKEVSGVEAAARWIESAKADVQRGVPGGSYSHGIQVSPEDLKAREAYLRQQRDRLLEMKKKERAKRFDSFAATQSSSLARVARSAAEGELEGGRREGGGEEGRKPASGDGRGKNTGILCSTIAGKLKREMEQENHA